MLSFVDRILNKITMYRLVLYYLFALAGAAAVFGAFGIIPYSPFALGFSVALLICVSLGTNELFARVFKAHPNAESVYITALILALIIPPANPTDVSGILFLVWAAILATASKYVLAVHKKHIFNPAAIAVVVTAFAVNQPATWWACGNLAMIPFIVIGGLLVTRKIQRFDLVLAFLAAALVSIVFTGSTPGDPITTILKGIQHAPLLFFAFVMLTEPLTTPPTRPRRIAYGAFVGILFAPHIHLGHIYSTPELALVVGNIFSYFMSPKGKYIFSLKEKREVGENLYDFVFAQEKRITFEPGQYMEWTLAYKKNDSRGNRRFFTIASSPTEPELHLGVKFPDGSSSFKKKMLDMRPGDTMLGGQLAGDFTLPNDPKIKLAFLAGGIGITPFRSMVKFLSDRGEKRDIVLLYSNRSADEIAYREVFDEAKKIIGLKTIYTITEGNNSSASSSYQPPVTSYHVGRIDAALIRREIPDWRERMFYISGTNAMVSGLAGALHELGIPRRQIKTDFFPGF
jgi:ferredoxin-NADP reductase/Na+-translocating ferredoxin:NAD+ oxidoreductase RnfD subunit